MLALHTLLASLDSLAPLRFAEPWDNVGLLIGDPTATISRVLFTIDLTLPVLAEAASLRCDLVIAYHPPIFDAQKSFTAGNIAFEAARRGISVYSPHTALDVAAGGTNDTLAAALGLIDVRPLKTAASNRQLVKLVTFVPRDAVETVAARLFAAGAGHIGNYSHCSFRSDGTGTFLGHEGTNPTVGVPGVLESAPESRLETVLPASRIAEVVAALRESHPYEEPAFDLVPLIHEPSPHGIGRIGMLPEPGRLRDVVDHLKAALNLSHLIVGGDPDQPVSRVAVCAGAGRSLLSDVVRSHAHLYLTGELPHHDALKLTQSGIATVLTLHSNSERPALAPLATRLCARHPELVALHSSADRDPLTVK
jgi:dinuclear metal center YbgI/SA1388 family protein